MALSIEYSRYQIQQLRQPLNLRRPVLIIIKHPLD